MSAYKISDNFQGVEGGKMKKTIAIFLIKSGYVSFSIVHVLAASTFPEILADNFPEFLTIFSHAVSANCQSSSGIAA